MKMERSIFQALLLRITWIITILLVQARELFRMKMGLLMLFRKRMRLFIWARTLIQRMKKYK
jgi:hypothetical protein